MMETRGRAGAGPARALAAAVVVAISTAAMMTAGCDDPEPPDEPNPKPFQVVVLRETVPEGEAITREDLEVVAFDAQPLPGWALPTQLDEVSGMIARTELPRGTPLMERDLRPQIVAPDVDEEPPRAPIVRPAAEAERRLGADGKAEIVRLATGEQAFVGILSMAPGVVVPLHRDPTEEFIYLLEGSGTMTIEGQSYEVGPETIVYMPAGAQVSFEAGPQRVVALQVFADPDPAEKYDAWEEPLP